MPGSDERPFKDTQTQSEWDRECVESAVYELLPAAQPSQADPKVVSWQAVHRAANRFDGFTGSPALVRDLLAGNELDTIESAERPDGFLVERSHVDERPGDTEDSDE